MRPESALQRLIRQHLSLRGFDSVHVPNGAVLAGDKLKRSRQMASLKADGLLPGFADLLVYASGGRIGHIEVKTPTGTIHPSQKACKAWLESLGHHYAICRSTDDVDKALANWGWVV